MELTGLRLELVHTRRRVSFHQLGPGIMRCLAAMSRPVKVVKVVAKMQKGIGMVDCGGRARPLTVFEELVWGMVNELVSMNDRVCRANLPVSSLLKIADKITFDGSEGV